MDQTEFHNQFPPNSYRFFDSRYMPQLFHSFHIAIDDSLLSKFTFPIRYWLSTTALESKEDLLIKIQFRIISPSEVASLQNHHQLIENFTTSSWFNVTTGMHRAIKTQFFSINETYLNLNAVLSLIQLLFIIVATALGTN